MQNTITTRWFAGKELALAFGCTLTISRIGSVVNFSATTAMYNYFEAANPTKGLGITLFVGAGLVALSFGAAIAVTLLDRNAAKKRAVTKLMTDVNERHGKEEEAEAPPAKRAALSVDVLKKLPMQVGQSRTSRSHSTPVHWCHWCAVVR